MSESFAALRRANPRGKAGFADTVGTAAAEVGLRIAAAGMTDEPRVRQVPSRRHVVGVGAVVALATAAAVAVFLTVGSSGVAPGVESAAAAVKRAASLTAASAEHSGTATVRMTHDGQAWAREVVRWNGNDVEITDDSPGGPSSGRPLLVVNGMMYGHDPCCQGWVELGPPSSIDPGSGTTPLEILAAVREDIGGTTLRRIAGAMAASDLTKQPLGDGSTLYSGSVAAGQIARESGFKEGQPIRVFPFGYVAHAEAADPRRSLDTAVTVGSEGVIRELVVKWGTWTYTVTYTDLGSTPPLAAPAKAKSLRELRQTMTSPSG